MKKRLLAMAAAGVLSVAMLAGCGEEAAPATSGMQTAPETTPEATEAPKGEGAENPGEVGMANPWRDSTEEEADALIPRMFVAPEGAKVLSWMVLDDAKEANGKEGALVDLQFDLDGRIFDARAQITGDDYLDLSGLYYEWTVEDEVTLANWGGGNMKGNMYRNINETGYVDLITWYDVEIGISYSLSVVAEDLDGFDIQAVAEQMYTWENEAGMGLLRDNPEQAGAEIVMALSTYLMDVYGDDVDSIAITVDKVYDSVETAEYEFLQGLDMTDDDVAFEVSYELKPVDGLSEEDLMILSLPDGVYDEESGMVTELHRIGVLKYQDGEYVIDSKHFGTGW
jgi:hypothetical protein